VERTSIRGLKVTIRHAGNKALEWLLWGLLIPFRTLSITLYLLALPHPLIMIRSPKACSLVRTLSLADHKMITWLTISLVSNNNLRLLRAQSNIRLLPNSRKSSLAQSKLLLVPPLLIIIDHPFHWKSRIIPQVKDFLMPTILLKWVRNRITCLETTCLKASSRLSRNSKALLHPLLYIVTLGRINPLRRSRCKSLTLLLAA
jgi:hypothetical protein